MSAWILLVTWIVPGEPTTSYQTNFGSEAACHAAQLSVMNSALDIKRQKWAEAGSNGALQLSAQLSFPQVSAVCAFTDAPTPK
jgi:hypothetical protein